MTKLLRWLKGRCLSCGGFMYDYGYFSGSPVCFNRKCRAHYLT